MAHIDYYLSVLSPYCYLAGTRLEGIAERAGTVVRYKPLDVRALFAQTGGVGPKDRHPNRMAYRAQELQRQSAKLGLPLNMQPAFWPTNPAPASYAVIAAQDAGGGDLGGLVHGLMRACWAEERDIAQDDVIGACLVDNGFDAGLTMTGMLAGAETYARNLDESVAAGAFGAPFYVTEQDQRFWGQDRLEDLAAALA